MVTASFTWNFNVSVVLSSLEEQSSDNESFDNSNADIATEDYSVRKSFDKIYSGKLFLYIPFDVQNLYIFRITWRISYTLNRKNGNRSKKLKHSEN